MNICLFNYKPKKYVNDHALLVERERARRISSAESCKHGQLTYREKKEQAKNQEEEKERSERLKIYEVL